MADINGNGIPAELHDPAGTEDWINLFYDYQCQPSYADGASGYIAQAGPQSFGEPGLRLEAPQPARLDVSSICP